VIEENAIAPAEVPAPAPKKRRVACAQCYRESGEFQELDELDWVKRHDGTLVCKRCRPEGQSGIEQKTKFECEIAAALALMETVPETPAKKLDRLKAIEFLQLHNVISRRA
jgi:hypothetical protein